MQWQKVVVLVCLFVVAAVPISAQQMVAVDIDKARIVWDAWVEGQGPKPEAYHVKCGDSTRNYNHPTVEIPPDRNSVAVKATIPGTGIYFCAVTASNKFGESDPSNEISFEVGRKPTSPLGTRLEAS